MMFSNVSPKLFLLAPHFIPYPLPKILLQNWPMYVRYVNARELL
jgi:hypothetical protein